MLFIFTILYTLVYISYTYNIQRYIIINDIKTIFQTYFKYLFIINKYLHNWSIEIEETINYKKEFNNNNKLLVILNHPKILDGLFVYNYLINKYPEHFVLFIIKKELINIPLIGKFIHNNFICLERNLNRDKPYLIEQINKYMNIHNKLIIVIFPEGTTFCKETKQKSDNWCNKNNYEKYNNLLCPRISGTKIIYDTFKPDLILNNTIYYMDDINHNKTNYEYELVNFNIIHRCKIIEDILPNNIDFEKELYNIWKNKDELLKQEYIKLKNLYNTIDKYYDIHPKIIKKNDLMFQTTKIFILLIPIGLYLYGYLYTFNVILVFITSYFYHKYNKFKLLDIILSSILIFQSYYNMKHKLSILFMSFGIISYFIGKLFSYHDLGILFHNLLHIFCAIHIIIEFIIEFLLI